MTGTEVEERGGGDHSMNISTLYERKSVQTPYYSPSSYCIVKFVYFRRATELIIEISLRNDDSTRSRLSTGVTPVSCVHAVCDHVWYAERDALTVKSKSASPAVNTPTSGVAIASGADDRIP